ncbi:MAG TPA: hypothetical protein PLS53_00215 [Thermoanaerobaculaceae bacterium]|nr:hypothetical protein [Thermoanaerobaculaceae bacterium]
MPLGGIGEAGPDDIRGRDVFNGFHDEDPVRHSERDLSSEVGGDPGQPGFLGWASNVDSH